MQFIPALLAAACLTHQALANNLANNLANKRAQIMYVFGDSLSDTGSPYGAWAITNKSAPAATPQAYWRGRWTNGPNWADYVFKWLKVPMTSFAVAGATAQVVAKSWISYGTVVPVLTLADELSTFEGYLTNTNVPKKNSVVCVVAIGTNDVSYMFESVLANPALISTIEDLSSSLIQTILGSASVLSSRFSCSGIIISNVAALQVTPAFLTTPGASFFEPLLVQTLTSINSALKNGVDILRSQFKNTTGTKIAMFDMYSFTRSIVSNCSSFNLTDCSGRCLQTNPAFMSAGPSPPTNYTVTGICTNPSSVLFWDSQHPTSQGHKIFAIRMLEVICQRLAMC